MVNLQTKLVAVGFMLIIVSATGYYWYTFEQLPQVDDGSTDVPDEKPQENVTQEFAEVSTSVDLDRTTVYRGDSYSADLTVTSNRSITVKRIVVSVWDSYYNRSGSQIISINHLVNNSGTFPISIRPYFPLGQSAVISRPGITYTISFVSLIYNISDFEYGSDMIQSFDVDIIHTNVVNQAEGLIWESSGSAQIHQLNGTFFNVSGTTGTNFILNSTINATGYTFVKLDPIDIFNVSLTYLVNGNDAGVSNDTIGIGNYFGMINITISGTFNDNGNISAAVSIPTKRTTLFAVIADNYWSGTSDESYRFSPAEFYLNQASKHFARVMNITIVPAVRVTVSTPASTNLVDWVNVIRSEVGADLQLASNTWTFGPGTFEQNRGYDIILIFTNKTMSNLGIVLATANQGAYNMAVHARGSLNTGNYRLLPSMADNLIQHEVSHIFGAPDRFTGTSDPSVMTKSIPQRALSDIISGAFWLFQTHWLEVDIQTMVGDLITTYWDHFTN